MDSIYLTELDRIQDELKRVEGILRKSCSLWGDWDAVYNVLYHCSNDVRSLRLSIREFQRDATGPCS